MGVIVTFNYPQWLQLFPQFAYLTQPQAQMYWTLATQFHRNDGGGPIGGNTCLRVGSPQYDTAAQTQSNLLNLVTAHIVQLFAPKKDGESPSELVGRITNASEGSVSVAADMPGATASSAWWNQTPMGSAYWLATTPYRTARYIPNYRLSVNPWPIIGNGWWGS